MSKSAWNIADAAAGGLVTGIFWAVVLFIVVFLIKFFKPKKSKIKESNQVNKYSDNNIVKNINSKISKAASDTATSLSGLPTEEELEEAAIEIVKGSLTDITSEEEEEVYAKASREFDENKKEGLWTKSLIQYDGDEQKAKFAYIKTRVQQFKSELIEIKTQKENEKLLQKEESKIVETLEQSRLTTVTKLEYLIGFYKKYKTNKKVLIPVKYINILIKKYNPNIHKTTLFPDLKELVKIAQNSKIDGEELIPAEEIEKLITYEK